MSILKIEKMGRILEGEFENWYIFIKNDLQNTGGYLILVSASQAPSAPKGFDVWLESIDDVYQCFKENNWKVEWLP